MNIETIEKIVKLKLKKGQFLEAIEYYRIKTKISYKESRDYVILLKDYFKIDISYKEIIPNINDTTEDYITKQAEWLRINNLKIGSRVRITRDIINCKHLAYGFTDIINDSMRTKIRGVYIIKDITLGRIVFDGWNWPYYVLEPAE